MIRSASDFFLHGDLADDKPAFVAQEGTLSYEALLHMSATYAGGLARAGVRQGDRVAVVSETCLDGIVALFGHHRLGAVHVPINPRYRETEVGHILHDCAAQVVCVDAAGAELFASYPSLRAGRLLIGLSDAPATMVDLSFAQLLQFPGELTRIPDDQDLALIIYTSGTTGPSKGVQLTFANILAGVGALTDLWEWSSRDILSLTLPLFHVHGLGIGVYGSVLHSMTVLLHRRFQVEAVLTDFATRQASIFIGVPTMYHNIVETLERAASLGSSLQHGRLFASGSAALSPDLHRRFKAATGHAIVERYGMTETLLSLSNPLRGERVAGSVGKPVPGYAVRIVDDEGHESAQDEPGELWIRGAAVMKGYWNAPQADAVAFRDGWFRTGDVATRNADGYIRIVGRLSTDIIKSGGFKLATREIEEAVVAHPDILEQTVFGLPDPRWGQLVAVAVVLRRELEPGESVELLRWISDSVAANLADFKRPRAMAIFSNLPRNAMGKIQKHEIVAAAINGIAPLYFI